MGKKKVLIIDDAALVRELLTNIISQLPEFEVVGSAADPHQGADKIIKLQPDVITLDIEMPKMDGLTFLEKLMRLRPMPVLVISSLSEKNSQVALAALELGAVDYVTKPGKNLLESLPLLKEEIHQKLLMCVTAKVRAPVKTKIEVEKKYSADAVITKSARINLQTTDKVIAIGASTGGTVALARLFQTLPTNLPGIVVVQHMPEGFTRAFANRLNNECELLIKEAEDNDTVIPGQVLIAPGNKHMVLNRSGTRYFVNVVDGPPVNRHRPSVDVLFRSVAQNAGINAIGVILTGMGDDGAEGMLEMKKAGAFNFAESEKSCTVFGMPKVAIDKGGVDKIEDLLDIGKHLLKYKI